MKAHSMTELLPEVIKNFGKQLTQFFEIVMIKSMGKTRGG